MIENMNSSLDCKKHFLKNKEMRIGEGTDVDCSNEYYLKTLT